VSVWPPILSPDAEGKFPALLAYGPYGKELQALVLTFPPQTRPSPLWDGCIEAGDINYIVPEAMHTSLLTREEQEIGGRMLWRYGLEGNVEGKDCYDLVEWIAEQPWCDGNVGMAGISYFAAVQILAAAEQPRILKPSSPTRALRHL